jgi:hypothetical protein
MKSLLDLFLKEDY